MSEHLVHVVGRRGQSVKVLKTLKGRGWLNINGLPATTASYDIAIKSVEKTPPTDKLVATGFIATEMPSTMGADLMRATVTLSDGSTHRGNITEVTIHGVDIAFDYPQSLFLNAH